MIDRNQQKDYFKRLIELLKLKERNDLLQPILDFEDKSTAHHPPMDELITDGDKYLFDTLGFFRSSEKDRVFLCPDRIFRYADQWGNIRKEKLQALIEIIYIHEVAHYVHYHYRPDDFDKCASDKDYIETWAQMCTWYYCSNDENPIKAEVFCELLNGQASEYLKFKKFLPMRLSRVTHHFLFYHKKISLAGLASTKNDESDSLLEELASLGLEEEEIGTCECGPANSNS